MVTLTVSRSEQETEDLGAALASRLQPGAWVLLYGDLGSGKTAFVRGIAAGLGVPAGDVSSPTFTLIQEYAGRLRLYHVDLYRLAGTEAGDLGLEELGAPDGGVVAVEWAEKLPERLPGAVEVRIRDLGDDRREVVIDDPAGESYSDR
jgi:tRNA threonylcarbamoyladenosine biosynthesis protein TsaE